MWYTTYHYVVGVRCKLCYKIIINKMLKFIKLTLAQRIADDHSSVEYFKMLNTSYVLFLRHSRTFQINRRVALTNGPPPFLLSWGDLTNMLVLGF